MENLEIQYSLITQDLFSRMPKSEWNLYQTQCSRSWALNEGGRGANWAAAPHPRTGCPLRLSLDVTNFFNLNPLPKNDPMVAHCEHTHSSEEPVSLIVRQ